MKPFVFSIIPDSGMLDFPVALVVSCLYASITEPHRSEVPLEISQPNYGGIDYFISRLNDQKQILARLISKGEVPVYSKSRKIPLEKDLALKLLAQNKTVDFLIYGHDLMNSERYFVNLLPDVITNAVEILSMYASELITIFGKDVSSPPIQISISIDTPVQSWTEKAITIANRIALQKFECGIREITARNICNDVAIELATDNATHGSRGPRSADGIRNRALKGWKFTPPTGTSGTSGTN